MTHPVKIYIEYKVKPLLKQQYENQMQKVLHRLPIFEADQINWFQNDQDSYIETFSLPTVAHFIALKNLRKAEKDAIFGELNQFIEGGLHNIHIHAVKVK